MSGKLVRFPGTEDAALFVTLKRSINPTILNRRQLKSMSPPLIEVLEALRPSKFPVSLVNPVIDPVEPNRVGVNWSGAGSVKGLAMKPDRRQPLPPTVTRAATDASTKLARLGEWRRRPDYRSKEQCHRYA